VYTVAIKAGATTLNVPDTVGFTTPSEFRRLVEYLREHVEGIEDVTISVHGHDDLGMAVANFLSAVEGGARQVEVTINGIGERAGNAAMEEVVMALHVRKAYYNPAFGRPAESEAPLTNIVLKEIYRSSKLVTALTGMAVQANKAIVGANAFAHESGIHQVPPRARAPHGSALGGGGGGSGGGGGIAPGNGEGEGRGYGAREAKSFANKRATARSSSDSLLEERPGLPCEARSRAAQAAAAGVRLHFL
jgi:hypothetical protein